MLDPVKAYKKMTTSAEERKAYSESWDRIFGNKEQKDKHYNHEDKKKKLKTKK